MEVLGLIPYASNATLLAKLTAGDLESLAVYKPRRGERPLWDFPSGTLCLRERAAWVVSNELGWDLVPPTVLRDGPADFGAVQIFIDEDENVDVRRIAETHGEDLKRVAAFDVVINNADRKGGHLLVDRAGKLWAIDHGVTFHTDDKLRTVVWLYESESVPDDIIEDLESFAQSGMARSQLEDLLSRRELDAMCERITELLRTKRYPAPDPDRYHVPWPPF